MTRSVNAIFFNEGSGYLFVQPLSRGTQGYVCIVRSIRDGNLYVRKKMRRNPVSPDQTLNHEVRLARDHPLIPKLIDWVDYQPPIEHAGLPSLHMPTAMFWQYCNGGDLSGLVFGHAKKNKLIPEAVIWGYFHQVLQVIEFLMNCSPAIVHSDLRTGNVFLHWPSEELPDFYVGDFGSAETFDREMIAEHADEEPLEFADDFEPQTDLNMLSICLSWMMAPTSCGDQIRVNDTMAALRASPDCPYSAELFDLRDELQLVAFSGRSRYHRDVSELKARVGKAAQDSEKILSGSVRWAKPLLDSDAPMMFRNKSYLHGYFAKPEGPWCVAKINPLTFQIMKVEEAMEYFGDEGSDLTLSDTSEPRTPGTSEYKEVGMTEQKRSSDEYGGTIAGVGASEEQIDESRFWETS